jgi:hypothetical protein
LIAADDTAPSPLAGSRPTTIRGVSARRSSPPRRVFIGLVEIAGYYGGLARGLRAKGVEVTFADLSEHRYAYGGDDQTTLIRLARRTARWGAAGAGPLRRLAAKLLHRFALVLLMAWAIPRHDVFVFGFRTSFLRMRELPLLRLLGKRIVLVFNGSDARPPYIDGTDMDPAHGRTIADCIGIARRKTSEIRRAERWADLVVSHALYLHLFERPAAGFQVLGLPGPLRSEFPPVPPEPPASPVRVLHAPSNPTVKGTALVRAAVERLRAEGLPIELVELHGVPNSVVHDEMARCHFVVDQAYSDGPMLGFAAEAAVYGRPAVVGSYGWDEIRRLMPAASIAPVQGCHPDDLESAIRTLATDAEHRRQLGADARAFVEEWAAADAVADRYLRLLAGERPPEWMCDPGAVRYVHGVGLSEARAREIVAAVLALGGVAALRIDDKPELQRAFARFAAEPAV